MQISESNLHENRRSTAKNKRKGMTFFTNIIVFILINILVGGVFSIPMVYYGPFKNIKEVLVTSAMTTLRHQYIATLFLSKQEIEDIMNKNKINDNAFSDVSGIKFVSNNAAVSKSKEGIEHITINENNFKGHMLIVKDPRRVEVGVTNKLGKFGMKLDDIVKEYDAIGGINAGGFEDESGQGNGGIPTGMVIHNGKVLFGNENEEYSLVGINYNGVLVMGKYTLSQIEKLHIKEAVSFSPFLVVNGEPTIKTGNGGWGIAPRTSIGQRKDGAIILLVIDGRQISSMGAYLKDVQDIMLKYGAYNAANLDGGSSTTMYLDGEVLNNPSSKDGIRYIPTAFIIK